MGERREKGTPKLTGDGKMLEVETGEHLGEKRSARATLLRAPTPTRARPRVHLPWEMSHRFGGGVRFDLLFFFFFAYSSVTG